MKQDRLERLKYVSAAVTYGTVGLLVRFVDLPSEAVAFYRGLLATPFILAYMRLRGIRPDLRAIRQNGGLLLLSGVLLGGNWIFLFAAYTRTTVAIASLCNYMAPLLVILLAPPVLKERLDKRKLPFVALAFAGILLVSGVWNGSTADLPGAGMGLAGALCFAAIVLCNRKLRDITATDRTAVQLAVATLTILPYVLLRNGTLPIPSDTRSLILLLVLGLFHTGFAYVLYFSGMANLPVQSVAILGYLEPAVSVLCSALFLQETMSFTGWIGALLILSAAVISELIPSPKKIKKENEI